MNERVTLISKNIKKINQLQTSRKCMKKEQIINTTLMFLMQIEKNINMYEYLNNIAPFKIISGKLWSSRFSTQTETTKNLTGAKIMMHVLK